MKWKKINLVVPTRQGDYYTAKVTVMKDVMNPSWGYCNLTIWENEQHKEVRGVYKVVHLATGFTCPYKQTKKITESLVVALEENVPAHARAHSSYQLDKIREICSEIINK